MKKPTQINLDYKRTLLSVLVRAPEEGYSTKELSKHLFKDKSVYHLEHILNNIPDLPIWCDEGRIGLLRKPGHYFPLPLEVALSDLSPSHSSPASGRATDTGNAKARPAKRTNHTRSVKG